MDTKQKLIYGGLALFAVGAVVILASLVGVLFAILKAF